MSRAFGAACWLALLPPGSIAAEDGAKYVRDLIQNRREIKNGIVTFTLTVVSFPRDKAYEGSAHRFSVWFEPGCFRVDHTETRPNDPSRALAATRVAHANGAFRVIQSDKPDFAVFEFSDAYVAREHPKQILFDSIDPRLLGIVPAGFTGAMRRTLGQVESMLTKSSMSEAVSDQGIRYEFTAPTGAVQTYLVARDSILPVKLTSTAPTSLPAGPAIPEKYRNMRVDVETKVESMRNSLGVHFDFPRRIHVRTTTGGSVFEEETIEILECDLNTAIDPAIYEWPALNPPVNARLIVNEDYRPIRSWDGTAFVKRTVDEFRSASKAATADAAPIAVATTDLRPSIAWVFYTIGALFVGVAAAIWLRRPRASSTPDRTGRA
jgi:hypothetical protein